MWCAFSDGRTGLLFITVVGPLQRRNIYRLWNLAANFLREFYCNFCDSHYSVFFWLGPNQLHPHSRPCLWHLGTDSTENTVPLLLFTGSCLSTADVPSAISRWPPSNGSTCQNIFFICPFVSYLHLIHFLFFSFAFVFHSFIMQSFKAWYLSLSLRNIGLQMNCRALASCRNERAVFCFNVSYTSIYSVSNDVTV
jgi:hypothetical protein